MLCEKYMHNMNDGVYAMIVSKMSRCVCLSD